jgi:hypothetical protein
MIRAPVFLLLLAVQPSADTATLLDFHPTRAFVTGYNTVAGQTDNAPCIAASGADICGRYDVVACPRNIPFGTLVEIRRATYVCEDRTARKYEGRFDISCDKNKLCPYLVAGWTTVKIFP